MRRPASPWRPLVAVGSALAATATVHTAWNLTRLRRPSRHPASAVERVSVLVPARDEAARIGHCLFALRAQTGVDHLEILVLDDRSTDGTSQVVAHHVAGDRRVRLLPGEGEPPEGWLGKSWACHRLARQATGSLLVFVDADVVLEPHALAAAVAMLRGSGLDLVSPYPRQVAVTASERLVQPLLQWSWLTFLPLAVAERSGRPSLVAANGQFLVVDAAAYGRAGGHQAVRDRVLEDVALLAAVKRAGGRGVVVDGTELATCRMYEGWPDLRDGYTKSLWAAFGSPPGAALVSHALAVLYVLPALAALRGSRVGLAGYLAAVAGRAMVAHRVGGRVWPDALAHPASVALVIGLTGRSWLGRRRGTLRWKGRPLP